MDAIVAEIMLNTLYICLFNAEIVVDATNNSFSRNLSILETELDTTNSTLAKVLSNEMVAIEVDAELRVFPNNFTIKDAELDNVVKILGIDFTIIPTELDIAVIVEDMALRMVTVFATIMVNEIR